MSRLEKKNVVIKNNIFENLEQKSKNKDIYFLEHPKQYDSIKELALSLDST